MIFAVAVDLVRVRKLFEEGPGLQRHLGPALLLGVDDVSEVLLQKAVEALVLDFARRVGLVDFFGFCRRVLLFFWRLLDNLFLLLCRRRRRRGGRGAAARDCFLRLWVVYGKHRPVLESPDFAEAVDVAKLCSVECDCRALGVRAFFLGELVRSPCT